MKTKHYAGYKRKKRDEEEKEAMEGMEMGKRRGIKIE